MEFLVNTLKPFIDSKYRTKKGPENTFIAGSSMGGLISMYALLQYPNVFGAAGVISPAFWLAPQLYVDAENSHRHLHRGSTFMPAAKKAPEWYRICSEWPIFYKRNSAM
jgi:predicted alpha/beta superfamily hydrolase